jgi:hypothetical protein
VLEFAKIHEETTGLKEFDVEWALFARKIRAFCQKYHRLECADIFAKYADADEGI